MALKNDECLPFVSIGVASPGLVLQGVATGGLHLVAGDQSFLLPTLADGQDVFGRCDLNPQMRQGTRLVKRRLVQSKVQRGIAEVEFRVATADLGRLDAEQFAVKLDALW